MRFISLLMIFTLLASSAIAGPTRSVDHAVSRSLSVGTTAAANSKAVADFVSTTKGILPPRMTQAQRDAITSPPAGLLIFNTDTAKNNYYDGAAWKDVGSGSGDGLANYILNGDAEENGTVGWAKGSQNPLTTGVAGTTSATFVNSTNYPLFGSRSFLFTPAAQYDLASYDFTIGAGDAARILQVTFDYTFTSGTPATGDYQAWIYGPTDGTPVLTQVAPYRLGAVTAGTNATFAASFQTAATGSVYRLILYQVTANISPLKLDNIKIARPSTTLGTPITDWQAYTPTFTGLGSCTSIEMQWRQVGDHVELRGSFTTGTPTNTEQRMSLPAGFTAADTSKIPSLQICGAMTYAGVYAGQLNVLCEPSVGYVTFSGMNASQNGLTKFNSSSNWAGTTKYSVTSIKVPILGWSSSTVMSSDADTRVAAAIITGTPAATGALSPIIYPTVVKDTHGAYNASTGQYTVRVPGFYKLDTYTNSSTNNSYLYTYVGGIQYSTIGTSSSAGHIMASSTVYANAGQTIDLRFAASSSVYSQSTLTITRVSGLSQIAASAVVAARYVLSGTPAITASTPTIINFDTKTSDTHGSVTTGASWRFTPQIPGEYRVSTNSGQAQLAAWTATNELDVMLYKNGSVYSTIGLFEAQATATLYAPLPSGTDQVYLNAGDYIDIRVNHTRSGGNITLYSGFAVAIERIGGVM